MEEVNQQEQTDNVTLLYIQKQEQLVLEYVRRSLDYEIKMHMLNERVANLNKKINELDNIIQNIERLT